MDNRTIQALLVCLLIWSGWMLVFPPEVPEPELEDDAVTAEAAPEAGATQAPVATAAAAPEAIDTPVRTTTVEMCRASFVVTTRDAAASDLTLLDHQDRYKVQSLLNWALEGFEPSPYKPYGEEPPAKVVLSQDALGLTVGAGPLDRLAPRVELVSEGAGGLVTRGVTPEGIEVTRSLTEVPGEGDRPCTIRAEVTWRNTQGTAFSGPLWVGMHDLLTDLPEGADPARFPTRRRPSSGLFAFLNASERYDPPVRPRWMVDGSVDYRQALEPMEAPEIVDGAVSWFGLADSYFGLYAVPQDGVGSVAYSHVPHPLGELAYGVHYVRNDGLAPGGAVSEMFTVYTGPKLSTTLAAVDPDLEEAVELGYLSMLAWPLLWFLRLIHSVIGNWGLSIITLTLVVKAFFFPLTQRSFQSSQAMQAIQPLMQEIRETYKDNPEEMNRRTMQLFQEHGVNPLGGCLPMLVQMPVWIALYSVLLSAVELYHVEFLWMKDLSVSDPVMILPAVVVGLMVLQQQFVPTGNMDPAQARMMKLMPLLFGFFFFTFPGGLVVYIFVNMVLSILQQWYIRRTFKSGSTEAATPGA